MCPSVATQIIQLCIRSRTRDPVVIIRVVTVVSIHIPFYSLPSHLKVFRSSMSLTTNKVAIVTGAAQGIGKAIALRLASDGFDVGLNDVPSQCQKLETLAAEIKSLGRKTSVVVADVSVEADVEKMVNDVVSTLGRVDVVSTLYNTPTCQQYHDLYPRWFQMPEYANWPQ